MAKTLAELKKQSASVVDKLKKQTEETSGGYNKDDRIWTPKFDKATGIGYAVVRFLPAPQGEEYPYVTIYKHAFKGPTGKWFIENCPSTLKKPSPVGQMNNSLWNSGVESDKDVARKHKRKTEIYANVLVINDPIHPENNGTVKLYRFGPMILEVLNKRMFPKFETDVPLNPFCPWEGADFEIRITTKQVGKDLVPNYESSLFHAPKPMGTDAHIEQVWARCHSLAEIIAEKNFKSYDVLKKHLVEVLGKTVGSGIAVGGDDAHEEQPRQEQSPQRHEEHRRPAHQESAPTPSASELPWEPTATQSPAPASAPIDMSDDMDFFSNL